MANRIPFVVFGDGPLLPTGLGRIARDLAMRLYAEQEALGIRFAQVGVADPGGWHWQAWEFFGYQPSYQDYGRTAVHAAATALAQETGQRPIVLAIFDPARVYDLTRPPKDGLEVELDVALWGYFPIDAHNPSDAVGGPAAAATKAVDRVLAYGPYGAKVLQRTLQTDQPVQWLPHGIDTRVFAPTPITQADQTFRDWMADVGCPTTWVIGAVASNQPRKDLGLLFATAAVLKERGHRIALWLHTDLLTKDWDIGELAVQFRFRRSEVLVTTGELTDSALAARYTASTVTIAPGLGEGFGYPLVESLSCGTPVVHGKYAGGVGLIPNPQWLVSPTAWRLESIYALLRPVIAPKDMAEAVITAGEYRRQAPQECAAYCRGSVAYLDWEHLWPRWRAWMRKGLEAHGTAR